MKYKEMQWNMKSRNHRKSVQVVIVENQQKNLREIQARDDCYRTVVDLDSRYRC